MDRMEKSWRALRAASRRQILKPNQPTPLSPMASATLEARWDSWSATNSANWHLNPDNHPKTKKRPARKHLLQSTVSKVQKKQYTLILVIKYIINFVILFWCSASVGTSTLSHHKLTKKENEKEALQNIQTSPEPQGGLFQMGRLLHPPERLHNYSKRSQATVSSCK